ncbi:hypothetical protein [Nocardia pseudovaccinii]|uniref:hypothetical protein n=1 Tax=Nocardia pseudovaccinii TaxID=189540 RepID=UPI0007A4E102|nr:hypothetical protein [Nocardia pseudovaccinii]
MASRRLLVILLVGIAVVVAAAFVLAITGTGNAPNPQDPIDNPLGPTTPKQAIPVPSAMSRPPTIDMFGNRLEVTDRDEGVALEQDPATRPDPGRLDYLTAPPARMQWQRGWDGAALPFSGSDGPAEVTAGVASGFADTPQGAALAAYDALARALAAPEGVWQQIVTHRYLGGGQALIDRFARSRKNTPDAARYVVVPEGFRILPGYRPDFAVVQIASKAIGGVAYSTWPMTWTGGDWRVRVPDDIETLWAPATPTTSLADFAQWKAVS